MDNSRRPGPGVGKLGHLLMVLDENWVVRRFLANNSVIVDSEAAAAEVVSGRPSGHVTGARALLTGRGE
jgi:hypothetical protein